MCKKISISVFLVLLFPSIWYCQINKDIYEGLNFGNYDVGITVEDKYDFSRSYYSQNENKYIPRKIRVYTWYPAQRGNNNVCRINDYLKFASDDIGKSNSSGEWPFLNLPVQLKKGIDKNALKELLEKETKSVLKASPANGKFPVIVLGQGLYYESPFSHFILCEYLASRGYIVVSTPLIGTQFRLVNISAEDIETEVRDMEYALSAAYILPNADKSKLGVIGYDLGGMAGLLLVMRNPAVSAFLSFDSGIFYGHESGLPNKHASYNENNFIVPWMHATQTRFAEMAKSQSVNSLMDRKKYGDSYLLLAETESHGTFTSYYKLGVKNAIPGYWGPPSGNEQKLSAILSSSAADFFDAYLKSDKEVLSKLLKSSNDIKEGKLYSIEMKKGEMPPQRSSYFVNLVIEKGLESSLEEIEKFRKSFPDSVLFNEKELNWLGYHFMYWWGREKESVELFKWIAQLFPASANAFDSLAEAYYNSGDNDNAILCLEKSLTLNPNNENAKALLNYIKNKK